MRCIRSRTGHRTAAVVAVLVLAAAATACGGGDGPKADAGERNAATWKKDVSVIVKNNREQPLAVVGVETTERTRGERLVSQYSSVQFVQALGADTVEFLVKLPTGDLDVVGFNPHIGDPTITINGEVEGFPTGTKWKWVYSEADPRIVVERKPDANGYKNFDFWVGW